MGFEGRVSEVSMIYMVISMLISFLVPLLLLILVYKKRGGQKVGPLPPLLGMAGFILFAMVLEQLLHQLLLTNPATAQWINQSTLTYALYGGLAAGVFEETARLASFLILRKRQSNLPTALAYGVGHGGTEAILLFSLTMLNNLLFSVMINAGTLDTVLGGLDSAARTQLLDQLPQLVTLPPVTFLAGGLERLLAVALHIALSVLVWLAVAKGGSLWYYPLAILLHAAVNAGAVLFQRNVTSNLWVIEGLLLVCVALIGLFVVFLYRRWQKKTAVDPAMTAAPIQAE